MLEIRMLTSRESAAGIGQLKLTYYSLACIICNKGFTIVRVDIYLYRVIYLLQCFSRVYIFLRHVVFFLLFLHYLGLVV